MSKKLEAPLSLSDCCCNICMEIFLEPVTLPCHHTLCKSCFQLTVEKASLCCPFCRRRVSSWARYNARKNTLVNVELWGKIQKYFPEECQRRINGQDLEEDACIPQPVHCLSKPGELRQEYEAEITKVEAERQAHEQEESKVSEEYIQRLLAEEEAERRVTEEKKKQMAEQLLKDEMLARELSFSLNSSSEEHLLSSLSPGPSPSNSCRTSKNKSSKSGNIIKYLSPKSSTAFPSKLLSKNLEEEIIGSSSGENNSTKNNFTCGEERKEDEMPTLSPQMINEVRNTKESFLDSPMPQLNICTKIESSPLGRDLSCFSSHQVNELANELSSIGHREDPATESSFSKRGVAGSDFKNGNFIRNTHLAKHAKINSFQETLISATSDNQKNSSIATCDLVKVLEINPVENKDHSGSPITKGITKRKSQDSPETAMDSCLNDKRRKTSLQSDEDEEEFDIQKQMSLEQQLYERYKQEEEDRRLALKLQKEIDKEQKTTNRKKGSPDEYHLRPKTSPSATESSPVRKSCKLSNNSMPPNSQTEAGQHKLRRASHNENWKPSHKLRTKSPGVKEGNVLNCVLNSSKNAELLPNRQKTILQMFKKSSSK
ncbi:E3 ubiquitin-protein ligase RNF168 isoform X2 [Hemicordylus capensis]|uniref:E3 ubiquitin-protein ligase RNF168 isoform X2 n=1 Tax=Hemicordylus capensis TaxID=884348 RepID=UPI0023029624|nr:E3 ubiquitin-protein ligase RNF168 isoform X2 [Hemicordylus capensis]